MRKFVPSPPLIENGKINSGPHGRESFGSIHLDSSIVDLINSLVDRVNELESK